jgi:hypothetical protein
MATAPRVAPAHRAIRLALELALLAAFGFWGWHLGAGGMTGALLAVALPVLAAALWGIFATPGDTGRPTPLVTVPGVARLGLEVALIGVAAYGVWTSGSRALTETMLTAFALHYAVTWPRVAWLVRR